MWLIDVLKLVKWKCKEELLANLWEDSIKSPQIILCPSKMFFKINQNDMWKVNTFSSWCSVVTNTAGTEKDVKIRIQSENAAFIQLYPVWKA
jgi:hypothetical protein